MVVLGAKPPGPGAASADRRTIFGVLPDSVGGKVDITDLYVAANGPPPMCQPTFVQAISQIDGWPDRLKTFSARIAPP